MKCCFMCIREDFKESIRNAIGARLLVVRKVEESLVKARSFQDRGEKGHMGVARVMGMGFESEWVNGSRCVWLEGIWLVGAEGRVGGPFISKVGVDTGCHAGRVCEVALGYMIVD